MAENVVSKDVCDEKHEALKEKMSIQDKCLNEHSTRIGTVEDAVLKLTILVEQSKKRDIFDKILTLCVFVMCMILAAVVLGPEITGKMIGGIR